MLVFVITSWTFDTAATPDTSNTRNCLQDSSEWTRSSAKSNRMVCIVKQGRKSREFFFFSLCFHFFMLRLALCHFSVSESSLPSSSLLPLLDHARIRLQKFGLISGCSSSKHQHTVEFISEFDPTLWVLFLSWCSLNTWGVFLLGWQAWRTESMGWRNCKIQVFFLWGYRGDSI